VANEIEVRQNGAAKRNDSELALAVLNAFKWDAVVPIDHLEVTVAHGYVTLQGQVDWAYQRDAAGRLAQRLTGVKGLSNLITVTVHPTPVDIKQRIERALIGNAELEDGNITVFVFGNTAVLKGTVRSYDEKLFAGRAAWLAPGIATVINEIDIADEE